MGWYRQRLKVIIEFMLDRLWSQTNITSFYIRFNVFFQAQPIVFPANQLFGFIDSKITCQKVIMMPTDQLKTDDFWYIR